jgi:hypothetical protein
MSKNEEPSWQERMISKFSGKGHSHKYVTELPEIAKHEELFKTPHLRALYSNSFTGAMSEARNFCSELSQLKVEEATSQHKARASQPGRSQDQTVLFQMMANQQGEAERCYVLQLNKYLDTASALGARYDKCKTECLAKDPDLAKELERRKENQNQSNEYFSPMYTSECLSECLNQFYFTFKRVTKYFSVDRGFHIESSFENLM